MEEERDSFLSCLFVFACSFCQRPEKRCSKQSSCQLANRLPSGAGRKRAQPRGEKRHLFFPPGHALFCPARLKYTFFTQGNKFILQFFFCHQYCLGRFETSETLHFWSFRILVTCIKYSLMKFLDQDNLEQFMAVSCRCISSIEIYLFLSLVITGIVKSGNTVLRFYLNSSSKQLDSVHVEFKQATVIFKEQLKHFIFAH